MHTPPLSHNHNHHHMPPLLMTHKGLSSGIHVDFGTLLDCDDPTHEKALLDTVQAFAGDLVVESVVSTADLALFSWFRLRDKKKLSDITRSDLSRGFPGTQYSTKDGYEIFGVRKSITKPVFEAPKAYGRIEIFSGIVCCLAFAGVLTYL